MSRHRVHEIFGGYRGKLVDYRRRGVSSGQDDTYREQVIRSYGTCGGDGVLIGYESRRVDGERGRFRVVKVSTMSL
ncbi:hypothetical protein [Nocardioides stalactiti]|uniref:hypothetical protein n=1 Tax=Nocardioides stalactiti TaxID=2755356 RepID=UPI0016012286|nr:hypothetical protein [Nocardioides stalactiti]